MLSVSLRRGWECTRCDRSLAADVNRSNSSATSMNTALECFVRILSNRKLRAVELKAPTDIHNAYEYQVNSHP